MDEQTFNEKYSEEQRDEIEKVVMLLEMHNVFDELLKHVPNNVRRPQQGYDNFWAYLQINDAIGEMMFKSGLDGKTYPNLADNMSVTEAATEVSDQIRRKLVAAAPSAALGGERKPPLIQHNIDIALKRIRPHLSDLYAATPWEIDCPPARQMIRDTLQDIMFGSGYRGNLLPALGRTYPPEEIKHILLDKMDEQLSPRYYLHSSSQPDITGLDAARIDYICHDLRTTERQYQNSGHPIEITANNMISDEMISGIELADGAKDVNPPIVRNTVDDILRNAVVTIMRKPEYRYAANDTIADAAFKLLAETAEMHSSVRTERGFYREGGRGR